MIKVPIIAGYPIQMWLGVLLLVMIVAQLLTGRRIIKIPFVWHRRNGYFILVIALVHAFFAMGMILGYLSPR